ncbi:cysteine synthase A [Candidatus Woesearchaeota archaeon]|nr:cysteine synthase A [Candidatus Woesearchaeota archaeon]
MIYENIAETIGNTPLVRLKEFSTGNAEILAKVESFNPGASIKDRIGLSMIEDAEKKGILKKGDTIIEPTSGNTGIGLALVSSVKGYKTIFVMPENMSIERRKLLGQYGAKIILTPQEQGMAGSVRKAEELAEKKGYFMPQQFKNPANPKAHEENTGPEIYKDLEGKKPDFFVAGVGTGGTITGAGKFLKTKYPEIKTIAVEPKTSAVLSGREPGKHNIQGIGAGFIPDVYSPADEIMAVSDKEALETSKKLTKKEGILAGISAGANLFAAIKIAERNFPEKKTIIVILPDTGERYLSTELFETEEKNV